MPPPRLPHRRGYTLIELLIVVVLLGILAGLAAPSLSGVIRRERARAALNQLAADLYLARMAAIRAGHSVELRFDSSGGRPTGAYRVLLLGDEPRLLKQTRLELQGVELQTNQGGAPLRFNSRGLPAGFNARSIMVRRGEVEDSLRISILGRVLRRY